MEVIFCTNLPSPYRVDFFNEFGKYCDLTVLYERHSSSERDKAWRGERATNFKEVYLELKLVGVDRARGGALRRYIMHHPSDVLIFTNYVSPATMEAILWCRLHNRQYYIEYDGGFNKKDGFLKSILKRILLKGAKGHLTTADEHINYLKSLGIPQDKIYKYPFTSVREKDIIEPSGTTKELKNEIRNRLGITESKVVLSVGRFSYDMGYGKGYDVLLKVASLCSSSIGFYIVGDNPTEEFVKMKSDMKLENVHYVGFKSKDELSEYYLVSDLFILLTRGDVWGLVVNEAMSYGLPIITSKYCVAGLELVKERKNGYVVNLDDISDIVEKTNNIVDNFEVAQTMGRTSLEIINDYTIENMALAHKRILIDSTKSCSSNA